MTRDKGQPAVASETPVLLFSIAKIKDSLHHGQEEGIYDPREKEEAEDSAEKEGCRGAEEGTLERIRLQASDVGKLCNTIPVDTENWIPCITPILYKFCFHLFEFS